MAWSIVVKNPGVGDLRADARDSFLQLFKQFYLKCGVDCLSGWYKLLMDNTFRVKKNSEQRFRLWFAHLSLLWSRRLGSVPLRAVFFRLRIVLKNPRFITSYHLLQKIRVTSHTAQKLTRNQNTVFLLFVGQNLGNKFGTNFLHLQFCRDDFMDNGFWKSHCDLLSI